MDNKGDIYDPVTRAWDLSGTHMIRQQDFWFIFGMTVFVLIPWFTVREVKVDVEIVCYIFVWQWVDSNEKIIAFSKSRGSSIWAWNATGSIGSYKPLIYHGSK